MIELGQYWDSIPKKYQQNDRSAIKRRDSFLLFLFSLRRYVRRSIDPIFVRVCSPNFFFCNGYRTLR